MKVEYQFYGEITIIMKVTILSNSRGGVLYTTIEWAKGLVYRGCDVSVFFLTQSREMLKEIKHLVPSKRLHFYCLTTSNLLLDPQSIIRLFTHDRADVAHINFTSYAPLSVFKKFAFKTPFIYTSRGLPQPWLEPSFLYKIAYSTESALMPLITQASAVVAISNYVKDMLKKRYGLDSEVIYHGIDANKFKPRNKTQSKKQLGYEEEDYIILFVGKLHPYKDPLTLIRAVSKVAERNKKLYLLMVGAGELYEEVKKAVSKLTLWSRVKLIRHVSHEELKLYYDAADLFVLPSVTEALGNVLLEAMASGVPVIASNSGACPEVIGNAGILFHQGDHIDLAEKIMELSDNKELSRSLSNAGLKRVREVFSWEDKINRYLELYKRMAEEFLTSRFRMN